MTFLLSFHVRDTSKIQVAFWFKWVSRLPKHSFLDKKSSKFISSRVKVAGRLHYQRFIVNFIVLSRNVMSCHVMPQSCPRHVTSCHVMPRHVTSCYVMSRNFTSCHATSCYVMSRNVTSCYVMSTSCHVMSHQATSHNVTSCHVVSRHVTSWHVISRRKSRDGHTTNASLSTDFFHTQLIKIRHNRVRWLSPKGADTIPHQRYII